MLLIRRAAAPAGAVMELLDFEKNLEATSESGSVKNVRLGIAELY
jgi:hypothetical protein